MPKETRQEKRSKRKANQRKMAIHGRSMKTLKKRKSPETRSGPPKH